MLDEDKVVWSNYAWKRRDYATIMSGRVVRYTKGKPGWPEISASREMICISGVAFSTAEQMAGVLDIIQRAWRQHEHLKEAHANDPLPEVEMP